MMPAAAARQSTCAADPLVEILALEKLHHQIRFARRRGAEVEHVDDVRMAELRGDLRFATKSREGFLVGRELASEDLDRNALGESELGALIDGPHPAAPDQARHAIQVLKDGSDDPFADGRAGAHVLVTRGREPSRAHHRDRCRDLSSTLAAHGKIRRGQVAGQSQYVDQGEHRQPTRWPRRSPSCGGF